MGKAYQPGRNVPAKSTRGTAASLAATLLLAAALPTATGVAACGTAVAATTTSTATTTHVVNREGSGGMRRETEGRRRSECLPLPGPLNTPTGDFLVVALVSVNTFPVGYFLTS